MERISVYDLDPDCFESECWLRDGEPFTGVVVSEKVGQLLGEWFCRGGSRWGPQREWYDNGWLREACYCIAGFRHGFHRQWYRDGRKYIIKEYRFGVEVRSQWWLGRSAETKSHLEGPDAARIARYVEECRLDILGLGGDPGEVPVQFLELLPGEWDDLPKADDSARWEELDR